MKKRLVCCAMFLTSAACVAAPILSITPSSTALTVRSDSETSAVYVVTNNSSNVQANLAVIPRSTGQASGIALQNDTCSHASLAAGASCQFGLVIQGANQPSTFGLRPEVCAFGGIVCSTTTAANILTVNVVAVNTHPFAYLEATAGGDDSDVTEVVPVDTTNNAEGNPVTGLSLSSKAPLVVSPDGSRVYVLEQPNSNNQGDTADVAVFSGGANPSLPTRIALSQTTGTLFLDAMAISPNGQTLYVAATTFVDDTTIASDLYTINLANDSVSWAPLTLSLPPPAPSGTLWPDGMAITPDGKRLFISGLIDTGDHQLTSGGILVINTQTGAQSALIDYTDEQNPFFQAPELLTVSPDGGTLYGANSQGGDTSGIFAINLNAPGYPIVGTVAIFKPASMTLSANGNTLYVSYTSTPSPRIARINTRELSDGTYSDVTYIALNHIGSGVALTPDQSTLFVAASRSFSGLQSIANPAGSSPIVSDAITGNFALQGANFIG